MDKTMIDAPAISVLLPVYNAEKYLRECIASVLAQSFADFELLVLNDGSADNSEQIAHEFNDPRIHVINNDQNLGLITTLNRGIEMARGEFIARMDADDVCMPERFEKQIRFMRAHPKCGLLGSDFFQLHGTRRVRKKMLNDTDSIKTELLFRSAFAHPTVMMRADVVRKNHLRYDPQFRHAEDYDLWTRIVKVAKAINLPEPLLLYRMHAQQVTKLNAEEKERAKVQIMKRQLDEFGVSYSDEEFAVHYQLSLGYSGNIDFLMRVNDWLQKLIEANSVKQRMDDTKLRTVLAGYWMKVCENSGLGRKAWKIFRSSELSRYCAPGLKTYFKFAAKLITRYKQHA